MKCAIINHDTKFIEKLKEFLLEFNPEIINYKDFKKDELDKYDFIVLSGGPIHISYKEDLVEEKIWMNQTNKPILAICLGLQIYGVSNNQKLETLQEKRIGFHKTKINNLEGEGYFSHIHYIKNMPDEFEILYKNNDMIEVFKHKSKPILAVQWHPEMSEKFGQELKKYFIKNYVKN